MRLLLDTHVVLWWCADDARLGPVERDAIRDPSNDVYLSAASVWEMMIKQALGRLRLPEPPSEAAVQFGMRRLPVTMEHAEATSTLPPLHRDPFDRIFVAQAQVESLTLTTGDQAIRSYPAWRSCGLDRISGTPGDAVRFARSEIQARGSSPRRPTR